MLLFSSMLDIEPTLTKDGFIKLVIEWNQKSPHLDNVIRGIVWHGERNVRYGDDKMQLSINEYRDIITARYEKQEDDGSIWDTDFTVNFTEMKMAVRLDRSYTPGAGSTHSRFSLPYLLTLMDKNGYVTKDNGLPLLRPVIRIHEKNLGLVADLVNQKSSYRLPVVYVSRTYYDEDPVDIRRLSARLKGVAHVFAQKTNITNSRLKDMCGGKNEYYGAIGIYYPGTAIPNDRFLYKKTTGYDEALLEKTVRAAAQYSSSQRIGTLYTWQGVNNAILRDRLSAQRMERIAAEEARKKAEEKTNRLLSSLDEEKRRIRETARADADRILDSFDEDMEKMQRRLDALEKENESLQFENQGLKSKLSASDNPPVLFFGAEEDLFPGEVKDIILSVLSGASKNLPENSRRAHVINDIIMSNDYRQINEEKAEKLKRAMKNGERMTSSMRQELTDIGFQISGDAKHYKLIYYGDPRYQTVLAKTPSDHRSGKNNAMEIIRSMF